MHRDTALEIKAEICRDGASLPGRARPGDAGFDLTAAEDVLIAPGETKLVPTGVKLAIPEGYEAQVRPRSGLSLRTMLRIPNAPGTIDSGYRGEVCVIVTNAFLPALPPHEPVAPCDAGIAGAARGSCGGGSSLREMAERAEGFDGVGVGLPPASAGQGERQAKAAAQAQEAGARAEPGSQAMRDVGARLLDDAMQGDAPCAYLIRKGDRIAQLVPQAVPRAIIAEVCSVSSEAGSGRGGGFGSTGVSGRPSGIGEQGG